MKELKEIDVLESNLLKNAPSRISLRGVGSISVFQRLIDNLCENTEAYVDSSKEAYHYNLHLLRKVLSSNNSLQHWQVDQVIESVLPDLRYAMTSSLRLLKGENTRFRMKTSKFSWPPQFHVSSSLLQEVIRTEYETCILSDQVINQHIHSGLEGYFRLSSDLNQISLHRKEDGMQIWTNNSVLEAPASSFKLLLHTLPITIIRKRTLSCGSIPVSSQKPVRFRSHIPSITSEGIDLLLPSKYSPIFLRLIHHFHAIPAGLHDIEYLSRESGNSTLSFPRDFPDTESGRAYWRHRFVTQKELNKKRPSGKKLGLLYLSYLDKLPNFNVIRSRQYLSVFDINDNISSFKDSTNENACLFDTFYEIDKLPALTMVSVRIHPVSRGVPTEGAALYVPTSEAYDAYLEFHVARSKKIVKENKVKHLGEWQGIHVQACHQNNEGDDSVLSRNDMLVGMITSGRPLVGRNNGSGVIATGFCDLQKLYDSSRAAALSYEHTHSALRSFKELASELLSNQYHMLILFHNPNSDWLRPAILEYIYH